MPRSPRRRPRRGRSPGRIAALQRRLAVALVVGVACVGLGVVAGRVFLAGTGAAPPPLSPAPVAAPGVPEAAPASPASARPVRRRSFLSDLLPPPAEPLRTPRTPRSVEELAKDLPLERKVAQLMLVGFDGTDQTASVVGDLRERDLGGVVVEARNFAEPTQLATLVAAMNTVTRRARHVPPFVLTAQEGGEFSEITDLPPSRAPGEMSSPREAARAAGAAGRSLKLLGVNGVLAPIADVGLEGGGTGAGRLYSDDPEAVAQFTAASVQAYRRAGLLVVPKHFPGLGAATQPTEAGPATVGLSTRELAARDLRPFAAAADAGAPAMMIGHGLYPSDQYAVPASLSRSIATVLLRRELRFPGLAITDDLASPALDGVSSSVSDSAVDALRAGADMVWISGDRGAQEAAYVAVLNAVRKRDLSRRRVDEAVMRVLRAKERLRLVR